MAEPSSAHTRPSQRHSHGSQHPAHHGLRTAHRGERQRNGEKRSNPYHVQHIGGNGAPRTQAALELKPEAWRFAPGESDRISHRSRQRTQERLLHCSHLCRRRSSILAHRALMESRVLSKAEQVGEHPVGSRNPERQFAIERVGGVHLHAGSVARDDHPAFLRTPGLDHAFRAEARSAGPSFGGTSSRALRSIRRNPLA